MRRTRRHRNEGGFALIAVLLVGVLLMGIGGALHESTKNETVLRGTHARSVRGFYTAEAGINRAMGEYRNIFLRYRLPTVAGGDFNTKSFQLDTREVNYKLQAVCKTGQTYPCSEVGPIAAGRTHSGLLAQKYKFTARATSENATGDTESSLGTEFQINYIPMFQFLAFFQNDLEILPGANMTLHGPVHTNGALYLNGEDSVTLTIEDAPPAQPNVNITAHKGVYRGRKNTSACSGTVSLSKLADSNNDGVLDKLAMACGSGRKEYTAANLTSWLGSVKRDQSYVAIPEPDVINRGGEGEFWKYSDLRIALDVSTKDSNKLYPIVVLGLNDQIDTTLTSRLHTFMTAKPGRIFYNDVPKTSAMGAGTSCASPAANTYCHANAYDAPFGAGTNTGPSGNEQIDVYPCVNTDLNLYPSCSGTPSLTAPPSTVYMRTLNQGSTVGGRTSRRGGFFNNREGKWVYMLNVNMHDLLTWNRAQSSGNRLFDPDDATEGGLVIFLTVKGPNSETPGTDNRYGVRVFGSPNLDFPSGAVDPTGLTVVSDQAIYVEGHYNVDATATGIYNSTRPKMPAAFMGDSINVLSSNWSGNNNATGFTTSRCRNDCQSRRSLNSAVERPATTTYINAAFLGGSDLTNGSAYGGGFENYPRFHEKWNTTSPSQMVRYRGSIVSLGTPLRSSGAWCGTGGSSASGCNIYEAPLRDWDYDLDFQVMEKLPPLTPRVISVEQILFTENFR